MMTSRGLIALAVGLAAALAGCVVGVLGISSVFTALAVVAVSVVGMVLLVGPLHYLPAAAFMVAVLVPLRSLPVPDFLLVLHPSLAIMLIWLIRSYKHIGVERIRDPRLAVIATIFVVYSVLGTIASPYPGNGVVWLGSFLIVALLPILRGVTVEERASIRRLWLILCVVLGFYAIFEFVLGSNPLYSGLYARAQYPVEQKWAIYRVTTTLGHPLTNATFFAAGFGVALGAWVQQRSRWFIFAALLSAIGVVLTASRGGLLALLSALVCTTLIVFLRGGSRGLPARIAGIIAICAGGVLAMNSPIVTARSDSAEASASSDFRLIALDIALRVARSYEWLGSGPGSSAPATLGAGPDKLVIESSYLQLLVSVGVPGVVALFLLLSLCLIRCLRAKRYDAAVGLIAYCVAIGFFNFIEANRPMHMVLGALLFISLPPKPEWPVANRRVVGADAPSP